MQNKHIGRSIQNKSLCPASNSTVSASWGGEPIGETGTKLSWKSFQWNLFWRNETQERKKKKKKKNTSED